MLSQKRKNGQKIKMKPWKDLSRSGARESADEELEKGPMIMLLQLDSQ